MKELRVRVGEVIDEAEGIRGFTLLPIDGAQLPAPAAGAHVDVHLGVGLTRQYSITNGPGELDGYRIAVKLEPMSRGGSQAMHSRVKPGNELSISEPRNNFPLAEGADRQLLFAGGIGITPLLSMARHLAARGARFRLHYFARAPRFAAFAAWLAGCGWRDAVDFHYGLDPDTQRDVLHELLAGPQSGTHLYMCGPGPFMDMVTEVARASAWSPGQVHCEYFSAPAPVDTGGDGFELHLARSHKTLHVPPERTIIEVMRAAGIEIETSCEQGVCGTCVSTVLEGEPDHRDLYLNADEQAEGKLMLPCVSRACGTRLVLDR